MVRTRNRPVLLGRCLKSLFEQIRKPDEVIVVNDAGVPVDHVLADVPGFPVLQVRNAERQGRAVSGNWGVNAATGDFIGFLDDDDLFLPDHLSLLEQAILQRGSQVIYSGCRLVRRELLDDFTPVQESAIGEYNDPYDSARLRYENYIPLINLLIDRSLWAGIGGFDESFDIFEDWDMLIRLSECTRLDHLPQITTEYSIWGREQVTQSAGQEDWLIAYEKIIQKHILALPEDRRLTILKDYWMVSQGRRGMLASCLREKQRLQELLSEERMKQQADPKSITGQVLITAPNESADIDGDHQNDPENVHEVHPSGFPEEIEIVQRIRQSCLFDESFYKRNYPDVNFDETDPLIHYLRKGSREGQAPHPLFDVSYYKYKNPDVESCGIEPLFHFLVTGGVVECRDPHLLFDVSYYFEKNPDIAASGMNALVHFIEEGAAQGRSPHPIFDVIYYVRQHPGLAESGVNPLVHFVEEGMAQGDQPHPLFNPAYYLEQSQDIAISGVPPLYHFLTTGGVVEGRNPHPLFDVSYYFEKNPDIAASGKNALVHFIEEGAAQGRSPHPLFDVIYYVRQHPGLAESGVNPLVHFVEEGMTQGDQPHPLFDPAYYTRERHDLLLTGKIPPLYHFLTTGGVVEGRDPHPLFDVSYYFEKNPDIAASGVNALVHFIGQGAGQGINPHPLFDVRYYLLQNPELDVSRINPLVHFIETGAKRLCHPHPIFDVTYYITHNPDVSILQTDPLTHFLETGSPLGYRPYPFFDVSFYVTRYPQILATGINPLVHYVEQGWQMGWQANLHHIPVSYMENCCSLLSRTAGQLGSNGQLFKEEFIVWQSDHFTIIILKYDERSCLDPGTMDDLKNQSELAEPVSVSLKEALEDDSERHVFFLKDGIRIKSDCLQNLADTFSQHPGAGIIGPKILFADGRLFSAGMIKMDGRLLHEGQCDYAELPEYNFRREVDAVSDRCFAVRRCLLKQTETVNRLNGGSVFVCNELSGKAVADGYKIIYQPEAVAVCLQASSTGRTNPESASRRYSESCRLKMKQVLVVDQYVPEHDMEAGSFRIYNLMKLIQDQGYHIVFWPDNRKYHAKYTRQLQRMGMEILYGDIDFSGFIQSRRKGIERILLSRWTVASRYIHHVRELLSSVVIFDTVDLHFIREGRREKIQGGLLDNSSFSIEEIRTSELLLTAMADRTFVVTSDEKHVLEKAVKGSAIDVIPTIHPMESCNTPFDRRNGLLFIGGFAFSPNEDGMIWFVSEIFPRIQQAVPGITLTILGSRPTDAIWKLSSDSIRVTGYVESVTDYFESARIFVSPLRFGAGMKGKIGQSLSYGLPVVTTSVGAEGIGLTDGYHAYIADSPESFAEKVVLLYQNPEVWNLFSTRSRTLLQQKYSPEAVKALLKTVWDEAVTHPSVHFRQIAFASAHNPRVSIVIPVYNQSNYTYHCLLALQMCDPEVSREIIIIDNGSSDDTGLLLSRVSGAVRVEVNPENRGFVMACRQGAELASGEFILFLNNDTQVMPGWLSSMIAVMDNVPQVGITGSKLYFPDGRLQEAGGIVYCDGSAKNYGRYQDPMLPQYCRNRAVDYCSGASLMIRRNIWERTGGFDLQFSPAYYEDTDLCFAVQSAGYNVMYCHDSHVIHYEGATAGKDLNTGYKAFQVVNQNKFYAKWKDILALHGPAGTPDEIALRGRRP